ncbi:hypothetical protein Ae201684P_014191 [Aphanomyces euteiches]|uniref:Uncharacterized protein n=1 Tax=Aphanomyces euteiches TaxID=100861 RepID=A0A6G0WR79_9STRA|nr:hypothetical protein Ae201684_012595 [Aphanomyces euteiches]KAH9090388.1 hypothetical protein Ae201684P_014191 [Aphanomyces euteiches]
MYLMAIQRCSTWLCSVIPGHVEKFNSSSIVKPNDGHGRAVLRYHGFEMTLVVGLTLFVHTFDHGRLRLRSYLCVRMLSWMVFFVCRVAALSVAFDPGSQGRCDREDSRYSGDRLETSHVIQQDCRKVHEEKIGAQRATGKLDRGPFHEQWRFMSRERTCRGWISAAHRQPYRPYHSNHPITHEEEFQMTTDCNGNFRKCVEAQLSSPARIVMKCWIIDGTMTWTWLREGLWDPRHRALLSTCLGVQRRHPDKVSWASKHFAFRFRRSGRGGLVICRWRSRER